MRKFTHKETALLILPVLALVGLGLMARSGKPVLVLEDLKMEQVSKSYGLRTYVNVTLRYKDPSLLNRILKNPKREGPHLKERTYYLVTEGGEKYTVSQFGAWSDTLAETAYQTYFIDLDIPIGKVPKSKGKITLLGHFSTEDGAQLPFSIVVRARW